VGGRVLVVDDQGFLVADSDGSVAPKTLYATSGRPEIRRAIEGAPFSQIRDSIDLGHDIMATAVPIQDEERLLGAVRITRSVQQVNDNIRNITIGLGAIGLAALAAGMLLAFGLAGSLSRPLTRLAGAAKRLGHGDLSARAGDIGAPARSRSWGSRSTRWPTVSSARSRHSVSSSPTPRTSSERRSPR
jgi:two-component system phosphate regulon sensor histidine kinase PhoR